MIVMRKDAGRAWCACGDVYNMRSRVDMTVCRGDCMLEAGEVHAETSV